MHRRKTAAGLAVLAAFALCGGAVAQHQAPPPESIWRAERQNVTVPDFPAEGLVLDIGGGGEGVIGQVKGTQVIAIDLLKRELEDAPPGPLLKIVMDARDLKFLDNAFPTATVFFTFMYIAPEDHDKVFREIHRVLAPGGRLLIWDVIFPKIEDKKKTIALFPFAFKLPGKTVNTGYGVHVPAAEQGPAHYEELAERTGFKVASRSTDKMWFFLELVKTPAPAEK